MTIHAESWRHSDATKDSQPKIDPWAKDRAELANPERAKPPVGAKAETPSTLDFREHNPYKADASSTPDFPWKQFGKDMTSLMAYTAAAALLGARVGAWGGAEGAVAGALVGAAIGAALWALPEYPPAP